MLASTSILLLLMGVAVALGSNSSREDRGEDEAEDVSKIGGIPSIWWSPIQHGATLPSLLAAGLSSLAIGAAVVSRSPNEAEARHDEFDRVYRGVDGDDGGDEGGDDGDDGGDDGDDGNDRVYRGVEARPHSWPWVAKIKTIFTHPGGR